MHHDDLRGAGRRSHGDIDNALDPSQEGYAIDDHGVSALSARLNPSSAPTSTVWLTNLRLDAFSDIQDEYVNFTVQLPHSYQNGTDLDWHVHFTCPTQFTNGQTVKWTLTYTGAVMGAVFPATQDATVTFTSSGTTAANTHCKAFATSPISGSSLVGSTFLVCRLKRDRTDTYTGNDVLLLGLDFHIRKHRLGSATANAST